MKKKQKRVPQKRGSKRAVPRSFVPSEILTTLEKALNDDLAYGLQCNTVGTTSEKSAYATAQKKAFRKKATDDIDIKDTAQEQQCIQDFLGNILRLAAYDPCVDGEDFIVLPDGRTSPRSLRASFLAVVKQIIADILGPAPELQELFDGLQHSSGTSLGLDFWRTNLEDKWRLPVTYTGSLDVGLLRLGCKYQGLLEPVLQMNNRNKLSFKHVRGSRFAVVPKNDVVGRGICVEGTGNMSLQLSLFDAMLRRLRKPRYLPSSYGLDLTKLQPVHQLLAFVGSVTRKIATVDMSMASDSVLTEVVRGTFPADWFYLLDSVRSKVVCVKGIAVSPSFFSTMGNATTFPVMTLLLYAISLASVQWSLGSNSCIPNYELLDKYVDLVSVFGDDCILPTFAAGTFISASESLGFVINREKSYYTESDAFRESCGSDFLNGRNIRPLYAGNPASHKVSALGPWLCTMFNVNLKKYISYFGERDYVYDKAFFLEIFKVARSYGINFPIVPAYFPDDSGLKLGTDMRILENYDIPLKKFALDASHSGTFEYWTQRPTEFVGHGMLRLRQWLWERRDRHFDLDRAISFIEGVCGFKVAYRTMAQGFNTSAPSLYVDKSTLGYSTARSRYTEFR